jgi:hypothetical protein
MVQDFPFTGIGIGTYRPTMNTFYPLFLLGSDPRISHVHNAILQVAVDIGIPGLVACVALVTTFGIAARRVYARLDHRGVRCLVVGMACGMLAHVVYGITDAFPVGSEPGATIWVVLAVVGGLYHSREQIARQMIEGGEIDAERTPLGDGKACAQSGSDVPNGTAETGQKGRRLGRPGEFLLAFACWVMFSLFAIVLASRQPLLGLSAALAGGVAVGFFAMAVSEPRSKTA